MDASSKSDRPRIDLPLQTFDYAMELLAVIGLLTLWGLATYHYKDLPAQIPVHFGPGGYPDRFGSKETLWLLPVIGLALYALLTWINGRPDRFNYMVNITEENAERQYRLATRIIRSLKTVIMFLFAFLISQTIGIGLGESSGLGFWIFPLLIATTLGLAFYNIFGSLARK